MANFLGLACADSAFASFDLAGGCEGGLQGQDNQEDRRWEGSIGGRPYATGIGGEG